MRTCMDVYGRAQKHECSKKCSISLFYDTILDKTGENAKKVL